MSEIFDIQDRTTFSSKGKNGHEDCHLYYYTEITI